MRVLVSTTPLVGHLFPTVPLQWALRAGGHEVVVATSAALRDAVLSCGLPLLALPAVEPSEMMGRDRDGRPVPHDTDPSGRLVRAGRGWGRLAARCLDDLRDLVAAWRPDLVVTVPVDFAGQLAAHDLGVPWVEHGWGISLNPLFGSSAAAELRPELTRLGLSAMPAPALRIDVCPPSMQRPGAPPGVRMRYVPFCGPARVPDWLTPARRRPLVCVTLGSLLPKVNRSWAAALLGELMAALPGLGVDVVVAVDEEVVAPLRPFPPGVLAAGWLPLAEVIPACDLVVHYGNAGTVMIGLAAGVPQVVVEVPAADAPYYAERLVAAGIGARLAPAGASGERVRAACAALLADATVRARAAAVAAELDALPAPSAVAAVLADRFGDR